MVVFSTFRDIAIGRFKNELPQRYDQKFARLIILSGQAALEIYRSRGQADYDTYINGLLEAGGIRILLIRDDNLTLTGDKVADEYSHLADNARKNQEITIQDSGRNFIVAQQIRTKDSISNVVIGIHTNDFPPWPLPTGKDGPLPPRFGPSFFAAGEIIRTIVMMIVVSGVCYFLASSLTKPIKKLQKTAQRIAGGDFSARVGEIRGRSGNEIADLGHDFDIMAERTEKVITAQKRLLGDISHELRSPLARLNVALELAKVRLNADNDSALKKIEQESGRLNELIGELLILTRLESGVVPNTFGPVNVKQLLQEVVEDCNFEASQKERRVRMISCSNAMVIGSRELLRRALENILRNATQYTARNTTVEACLSAIGNEVQIIVVDHGAGVPEADIAHLFEPFYRVAKARERETGGVGIGLAITEQAVKTHGGRVTARNNQDHPGLIVTIVLPLAT